MAHPLLHQRTRAAGGGAATSHKMPLSLPRLCTEMLIGKGGHMMEQSGHLTRCFSRTQSRPLVAYVIGEQHVVIRDSRYSHLQGPTRSPWDEDWHNPALWAGVPRSLATWPVAEAVTAGTAGAVWPWH